MHKIGEKGYKAINEKRGGVLMGKFAGVEKLGLRDRETGKLIAVYPYKSEGTDAEIEEKVKYWYYQQGCENEEQLKNAYVDLLTENEMKSNK